MERERDHCSKSGIMPVSGLSHTPLTSHSARWRETTALNASWWTVHAPLTSHSARWRETTALSPVCQLVDCHTHLLLHRETVPDGECQRDHCSKSGIMPVSGLSHTPLTSHSARWRETTALNPVLCQLVDCHTSHSTSYFTVTPDWSARERDHCSKSGIMPVSGLSHTPLTSHSAR